jgi:hypothetical protein
MSIPEENFRRLSEYMERFNEALNEFYKDFKDFLGKLPEGSHNLSTLVLIDEIRLFPGGLDVEDDNDTLAKAYTRANDLLDMYGFIIQRLRDNQTR